jgi:hypothetical protein
MVIPSKHTQNKPWLDHCDAHSYCGAGSCRTGRWVHKLTEKGITLACWRLHWCRYTSTECFMSKLTLRHGVAVRSLQSCRKGTTVLLTRTWHGLSAAVRHLQGVLRLSIPTWRSAYIVMTSTIEVQQVGHEQHWSGPQQRASTWPRAAGGS